MTKSNGASNKFSPWEKKGNRKESDIERASIPERPGNCSCDFNKTQWTEDLLWAGGDLTDDDCSITNGAKLTG